MKKAKTIWVMVADEAIARILEWPTRGHELVPVEELTDPSAHAKGPEVNTDAVGRRAAGASAAVLGNSIQAGATASAGEGVQHLAAENFARTVAQRLDERLREQRFDELRIAAAPRFLGLLRRHMTPQVAAVVSEDIAKDLIHESNRDLSDRLMADHLPEKSR
jgi:protein required for attachment to host cells